MARPTIYTPELEEKARGYIEHREGLGKLPTIEGLSRYLDVNRDTLYDWKGKHIEFSDILDEIMAEQGDTLITKALEGEYNSTIAKLMLTKHNYSDKQDIDHTTKGKELPTPILGGTSVKEED